MQTDECVLLEVTKIMEEVNVSIAKIAAEIKPRKTEFTQIKYDNSYFKFFKKSVTCENMNETLLIWAVP